MKVGCFSKRSKGCFNQRVGLGFGFTNILQETWVHMFQPSFLLNCIGFPIEAWIFQNFVMFYPPVNLYVGYNGLLGTLGRQPANPLDGMKPETHLTFVVSPHRNLKIV